MCAAARLTGKLGAAQAAVHHREESS